MQQYRSKSSFQCQLHKLIPHAHNVIPTQQMQSLRNSTDHVLETPLQDVAGHSPLPSYSVWVIDASQTWRKPPHHIVTSIIEEASWTKSTRQTLSWLKGRCHCPHLCPVNVAIGIISNTKRSLIIHRSVSKSGTTISHLLAINYT